MAYVHVQYSRVLCSTTDDAESPRIVDPPEDMVVYTDTVANYSCEVNTVFAHWNVNGTDINSHNNTDNNNPDLDTTHDTIGRDLLCTLHFRAKAKYNGSLIQCVGSEDGNVAVSDNATLLIQGNM